LRQKILIVSSEFPPGPGGIGHHAWYLSKQLSKFNIWEVHVITPDDYTTEHESSSFDIKQTFIIRRFKRRGRLTYIIRIYDLCKLLITNHYQYFICSGKFPLWMIWIKRILSRDSKSICILHGSEVNVDSLVLRKLTHISIFNFDKIVSVSSFTQNLLPNWIIQTNKAFEIIPNGLDLSDFRLTKNFELSGNPVLLTVGHVSPRKGQHRLIRALPELIKFYPQVKYHLVGRPIDMERLKQLATSLNVLKHLVFHGSVSGHENLWDYYNASDVFILLSENQKDGDVEGFGIVALEANILGKPVVGAKKCGVEEAVMYGKSGMLVDGDNVQEICNAVIYCYENSKELKDSSIEWAMEHNWDIIGERFKKLLIG
jgi:phosphatidylinositol alpha-1,6-mannosyltransferase